MHLSHKEWWPAHPQTTWQGWEMIDGMDWAQYKAPGQRAKNMNRQLVCALTNLRGLMKYSLQR